MAQSDKDKIREAAEEAARIRGSSHIPPRQPNLDVTDEQIEEMARRKGYRLGFASPGMGFYYLDTLDGKRVQNPYENALMYRPGGPNLAFSPYELFKFLE